MYYIPQQVGGIPTLCISDTITVLDTCRGRRRNYCAGKWVYYNGLTRVSCMYHIVPSPLPLTAYTGTYIIIPQRPSLGIGTSHNRCSI